jgi:outer membrane protein assembly factor BamB
MANRHRRRAKGEFVPGAPIAWNGLVFIANGGGDAKGAKGRMYALDAKTGKIVWEFYLVPNTEGDPARGPQGASPLDLSSWRNPPGIPISGGGSWTSYTLDSDTGELYVPVGNPSPVYAIDVREGENLFTNSIVVLDARTGAYKRHFKLVPRDWHDWDVTTPPDSSRQWAAGGCCRRRRKTATSMGSTSRPTPWFIACPSPRSRTPTRHSRSTGRFTSARALPGGGGGVERPGV